MSGYNIKVTFGPLFPIIILVNVGIWVYGLVSLIKAIF